MHGKLQAGQVMLLRKHEKNIRNKLLNIVYD